MDWLSFWAQCFRWAFWRWEHSGTMLTTYSPIIMSVFSWAFALLGALGIAQFIRKEEFFWLVSIIPIFFMAFLIAPYKLWSEQRKRANEAEKKLKPCISVEPIIIEYGRLACIRVRNLGNETIYNCVGYLHAVYWEIDKRLRQNKLIPPVCLQWSPRHGGEDKKKELTFIREADLNVVVIHHLHEHPWLCVFNSELRSVYNLSRPYSLEEKTYILDIEISAENCAPLRQKYKLTPNPEGKLGFAIYEATNS